jgi:hypothetical protein
VLPEDRKHPTLVLVAQVEKAVPGEEAVEGAAEGQRPHVGDTPVLEREALPADADELRRRVRARYGMAFLDEVPPDRLGGAAPDVEDRGARGQKRQETVEPSPFDERRATVFGPSAGMPPIQPDDTLGFMGHGGDRPYNAFRNQTRLCPGGIPSRRPNSV